MCARNSSEQDKGPQMEQGFPYTNELIHASSPYLREHAHNPVHWLPWGAKALKKAAAENKPVIISIGYSACHWCHVMEHESYADPEVAAYMNDHFIAIKVDREEHPDVDQIYMAAAQLLTGSGGWPLNAFALPDGKPFYAVTYLPRTEWVGLLQQVEGVFRTQPEEVKTQAESLTKGIAGGDLIKKPGAVPAGNLKAIYRQLFDAIKPSIDTVQGGFGRAPKFPMPTAWEFLLQYHYLTGEAEALEVVMTTLDHMAGGGIYDQLGGGFARYATDGQWRIPHFEKMLYDNGQLVSLYAHAYQVTRKPRYAGIIRETLAFIGREMTSPEGGFYASLNADSEGVEGKFYVWTALEIDDLLDQDVAALFKNHYQVTSSGNWEEGENILYLSGREPGSGLTPEDQARLEAAKRLLLERREQRVSPSLDNKILASWNALMLKGYLDAYAALGDAEFLQRALRNARFLEEKMIREDGSLFRNYMDGAAGIAGLLEDYALVADALVALYQTTFDPHWLSRAEALVGYAIAHFRDTRSGLFFYAPDLSAHLIVRKLETEDNVIPSANSVMAHVLYRLGTFLSRDEYLAEARGMLDQVVGAIPTAVPYFSHWARLLGMITSGTFEVAVMGADHTALNRSLQSNFLPTCLFMGGAGERLPLLQGKLVSGQTLIYVCRERVCKQPVRDAAAALAQINGSFLAG